MSDQRNMVSNFGNMEWPILVLQLDTQGACKKKKKEKKKRKKQYEFQNSVFLFAVEGKRNYAMTCAIDFSFPGRSKDDKIS